MHFCRLACRISSAPSIVVSYVSAFFGLRPVSTRSSTACGLLASFHSTAEVHGHVIRRHQRVFSNWLSKVCSGTITRARVLAVPVRAFRVLSFQGPASPSGWRGVEIVP